MTSTTDRIKQLDKQIAELQEQYNLGAAQREESRKGLIKTKELQEQIKELQHQAEIAEQQADYNKVAEIKYGQIPPLQKKLDEIENEEHVSQRVEVEDVASIIAKRTGIPAEKLVQSESNKLTHLEDELGKRLIGQKQAVHAVANAIRRARAGLKDPNKPIGSFLFLGPTGVGKTELAKALAELLFNDEKAIIRLDMSEYQEKHTVSRLIGSPPGYVGHEEGGQLTEAVRRRPYSLILFDEVEKAHRDVFNTLLQLLDDGRLTDSKGRTVDFKHTVIILTSNIGSDLIMQTMSPLSDKKEKSKPKVNLEQLLPLLQQHFRPEFLNRLDDIVVFDPINKEMLREIIDIQLHQLQTNIQHDKKIKLTRDESLIDFLGEVGRNPQFGARPLKRAIQTYVVDKLAMQIIEGTIKNGDSIIIQVKDKTIQFKTSTI